VRCPNVSDGVIVRIPKYRKHTVRDFGFVEWRGKRHRLPGAYNSPESRAAYKAFLRDNVIEAIPEDVSVPRPATPTEPVTIKLLAAMFLDYAEGHYPAGSPSEYQNVRLAVTNLLKLVEDMPADEFGPRSLKQFREALIHERNHSRTFINSQVARVRRMFRWGASEEIVPVTVWQSLSTVAGLQRGRAAARETESRQPVAWSDIEPVLTEVAVQIADMIRVQWHTAVRSDSLCAASWSQFDKGADIWLWRPKHKMSYRGQRLVIPVGPRCQAIFAKYRDREPFLFDPRLARGSRTQNDHYTTRSYYQPIRRAINRINERREEAGEAPLSYWTPHQLRHTRATEIREQHGIEAAQALLGHGSLDATQIYSDRRLELAKRLAAELG